MQSKSAIQLRATQCCQGRQLAGVKLTIDTFSSDALLPRRQDSATKTAEWGWELLAAGMLVTTRIQLLYHLQLEGCQNPGIVQQAARDSRSFQSRSSLVLRAPAWLDRACLGMLDTSLAAWIAMNICNSFGKRLSGRFKLHEAVEQGMLLVSRAWDPCAAVWMACTCQTQQSSIMYGVA